MTVKIAECDRSFRLQSNKLYTLIYTVHLYIQNHVQLPSTSLRYDSLKISSEMCSIVIWNDHLTPLTLTLALVSGCKMFSNSQLNVTQTRHLD